MLTDLIKPNSFCPSAPLEQCLTWADVQAQLVSDMHDLQWQQPYICLCLQDSAFQTSIGTECNATHKWSNPAYDLFEVWVQSSPLCNETRRTLGDDDHSLLGLGTPWSTQPNIFPGVEEGLANGNRGIANTIGKLLNNKSTVRAAVLIVMAYSSYRPHLLAVVCSPDVQCLPIVRHAVVA